MTFPIDNTKNERLRTGDLPSALSIMDVTLIDSPVANVANIARALRTAGASLKVTRDPAAIARASKLVLPGVGAFAAAMRWLEETGVDVAVRDAVAHGAALLGICVGHQALFDVSNEMGTTRGLGLIRGEVKRFEGTLPIPQIGWNCVVPSGEIDDPSPGLRPPSPGFAGREVSREQAPGAMQPIETLLPSASGGEGGRRPDEGTFESPLFASIPGGTAFYFVNSFAASNVPGEIARADYGGPFTAAVQSGRVFGVQFHPEKSSTAGLRVLRNFVEKIR
jgi:imidazole glycerol-phosphate synthase subunit HisH